MIFLPLSHFLCFGVSTWSSPGSCACSGNWQTWGENSILFKLQLQKGTLTEEIFLYNFSKMFFFFFFWSSYSFCYCKITLFVLEIPSCYVSVALNIIFSSYNIPQTTLLWAASTFYPFCCCIKHLISRALPGVFFILTQQFIITLKISTFFSSCTLLPALILCSISIRPHPCSYSMYLYYYPPWDYFLRLLWDLIPTRGKK